MWRPEGIHELITINNDHHIDDDYFNKCYNESLGLYVPDVLIKILLSILFDTLYLCYSVSL